MAAGYQEIHEIEDEDFIDESGMTSLEPEGAGHHHHPTEGWTPMPEPLPHDRWEGAPDRTEAYDRDEMNYERGKRPVEGDGITLPE